MHNGRRTGSADQRARAALAPLVATGLAVCWRCEQPIDPDEPWDAGHRVDIALGGDPDAPRVPEHRSCNRAAGGRLARHLASAKRSRRRTLEWLRFFPDAPPGPARAPARSFPRSSGDPARTGRTGIPSVTYPKEIPA